MSKSTKENPLPFSILASKLNLPGVPKIPRGITKRSMKEYYRLQSLKKKAIAERKKILAPYRAGKFKDYEGDGYFKTNVYYYEGEFYGA